jgi:hypothetical protein
VNLDVTDASVTGVLNIGQWRFYSLGNGVFIVGTTHHLWDEMNDLYGGNWYENLKSTLHAEELLVIHADDGSDMWFTPLQEGDSLKTIMRPLVAELLAETLDNDG